MNVRAEVKVRAQKRIVGKEVIKKYHDADLKTRENSKSIEQDVLTFICASCIELKKTQWKVTRGL